MILISHRGNLTGREEGENLPNKVLEVLKRGFNCEIDVWHKKGHFYLGHDKPLYKVSESFLENQRLWCHAKNSEALSLMTSNSKIHCFWHQEDYATLTSKGFIWTTNQIQSPKTIIMDINTGDKSGFCGVCSDFIGFYENSGLFFGKTE